MSQTAARQVEMQLTSTEPREVRAPLPARNLFVFCLVAVGIKSLVLVMDPNPQFFLGDSGSYLHSALTGWIPPDRSYVYGFLIHALTLASHSLFSLVFVQVLASSVCAGLLGWLLLRFLRIERWLAIISVVFCALDPLQLLYERFVMAESFSLLAAMVFVTFVFHYLEGGNYYYLIAASVAGIAAVGLRISFLPTILTLSFAAPLIRFGSVWFDPGRDVKALFRSFLISVGVITFAHFTLHTGYKILTGALTHRSPAYQYADGLFLLSAWSPLLAPADFQAAGVSMQTVQATAPWTPENRRVQRWMPNGLVAILETECGDVVRANSVAKKISLHILERDPLGIARLAVWTYVRGWEHRVIKRSIREDMGDRVIPAGLVKVTAEHFQLVTTDMQKRRTVTKRYFQHSITWYRLLLLTPILLLIATPFSDRITRRFLITVTLFAGIVLVTANALSVDNSIRYLHPLGWSFLFLLTFAVQLVATKLRTQHAQINGLRPSLTDKV